MVRSIFSTLAILAVAATVAAAPAPEITDALSANADGFKVSDWLESYIKDPGATSLDEIDAWAEKNKAVAAAEGTSLTKRGTCTSIFPAANALDAMRCLVYLVSLQGDAATCKIRGGVSQASSRVCRIGRAEMRISKLIRDGPEQSVACIDVARQASLLFDDCWTTDGNSFATVQGSDTLQANQNILVNLVDYNSPFNTAK